MTTAPTAGAGTYALASWLFLRALGLIYFAAFASLARQILGLVGSGGILPAVEVLAAHQHWGLARFWRWPTLCWLRCSDRALLFLSWGGAFLSLLLIAGIAPVLVLALLWMFYLSLFTVCRLFLCYQWDILLLEAGFLALFLAPAELAPRFPPATAPSSLSVWLLWWLLFRLMFWSGVVKLRSGDAAWRSLMALKYHYETQPLPTRVAWHAQQLPVSFHRFSVVIVLAIELIGPFLIPAPPPWRHAVGGLFVFLMVLIQLTGNYAFFNLLGIALSLLLFDDAALAPVFQSALPREELPFPFVPHLATVVSAGAATLVLLLSLDSIARLTRRSVHWPTLLARFFDMIEPCHIVNSYGLFAVMTSWRPEIIVEGSHDGREWRAYEFKWKPGDLRRPPRFVAPHQPRLDWQMWFAALGFKGADPWFDRFRARLLQGSPAVLALLRSNPFPGAPPRYVRGVLYDYRFTSRSERRLTGEWWSRERARQKVGEG